MTLTASVHASPAPEALPILEDKIRSALKRSARHLESIATNGGWVGIYDLETGARFGESFYEKAKAQEIWVQPPGTPSVGQVFLRAHRLTADPLHFKLAYGAGRALAWGQGAEGGWDHRVDVSSLRPDSVSPSHVSQHGTFDDEITQGALRFLMALDEKVEEPWLTESIALGLQFMVEAQYENGGWPQWFPLRGGYHDAITFNDGAMNDCIDVMLEAHRRYDRPVYLECVRKAGDLIIQSQGEPPQAGWGQQIDAETLKPIWARRFEPPGICSAVTARNIHTLLTLHQALGDERYLAGIPAAIAWLQSSALPEAAIHSSEKRQDGDSVWARLYEVGTNKPLYGDREDGGKMFYDINAISHRERTSYGWQGTFGIPSAIHAFQHREAERSTRAEPRSVAYWSERLSTILAAQDDAGRWTDGKHLRIHDAVRNLTVLCDALEDLQRLRE